MTNNYLYLKENTSILVTTQPRFKSKIAVGNYIFMNTKHFNWFQKHMMDICFGAKVEDIKEKNE